jgi:hypothetical protein
MNASEPLMRCRKQKSDVKTGGLTLLQDQSRGGYRLGGVRHAGGMNLSLALVENVGTCRPDGKGETQMGGPHEGERTDAGHGGGPTRSSIEVSVMEMKRRGWIIWLLFLSQQEMGGARG